MRVCCRPRKQRREHACAENILLEFLVRGATMSIGLPSGRYLPRRTIGGKNGHSGVRCERSGGIDAPRSVPVGEPSALTPSGHALLFLCPHVSSPAGADRNHRQHSKTVCPSVVGTPILEASMFSCGLGLLASGSSASTRKPTNAQTFKFGERLFARHEEDLNAPHLQSAIIE